MSRRTLFVFKKLFPGGGSTTPIRSVSTPISGGGDGSILTNLFDKWCEDRGKKYASEEEKQRRLKVFERNYDTIIKSGNRVKLHRYGYLDVDGRVAFCVDVFDEKKYASKQMIHCYCPLEWDEVIRRLHFKKLKLVVVEFSLSWQAPILSKTAKKTPNVLFLKLDCDDDMGMQCVARRYKIKVFPSIVFFKEGAVMERIQTTEEEAVAAKITRLYDLRNPVDA
ncbi:uncharacterized protein LOC121798503 [Salvia splendens]|uniref:uncharacterized protein LOC121798503 n=1 Tax=Salvia splendens TaxID=180675 RepID=UPI001102CA6F|nr:uncharacterized protein LOC121798503 [Salvia splendens]XP_042053475.1 uncharacterized protein LOC121798503 [Salvia splendens]